MPVGSGSEVAGDWSRRWAEVLSRFVVIPVNAVGPEPEAALPGAEVLSNWTTGGWREIVWRLNVFFYVTQREAFNTALGLLTATATVVPAVAKMAGLFGERRSA